MLFGFVEGVSARWAADWAPCEDLVEVAVNGVLRPDFDLAAETFVVFGEHLGILGEEGEGVRGGRGVKCLVEVAEASRDQLLAHAGLEGGECRFGRLRSGCFGY